MNDTTPKAGDPIAALFQRLRKGRKTDQKGAFGGRLRQKRPSASAIYPEKPALEQP